LNNQQHTHWQPQGKSEEIQPDIRSLVHLDSKLVHLLEHHASPTRPDAEYDKQQDYDCRNDDRCHDECSHNHDCGR
jgi:hypothetical protein